jgi:segregation and condensation protein B
LTIIAYYQPATKAMVEQIRSVDSSYSITALMNKKLIEEAGRLNVPGRPILYRTTPDFLRTFGISSLEELPPIEKVEFGEPIIAEEAAQEQAEQAQAEQEQAAQEADAAKESSDEGKKSSAEDKKTSSKEEKKSKAKKSSSKEKESSATSKNKSSAAKKSSEKDRKASTKKASARKQ